MSGDETLETILLHVRTTIWMDSEHIHGARALIGHIDEALDLLQRKPPQDGVARREFTDPGCSRKYAVLDYNGAVGIEAGSGYLWISKSAVPWLARALLDVRAEAVSKGVIEPDRSIEGTRAALETARALIRVSLGPGPKSEPHHWWLHDLDADLTTAIDRIDADAKKGGGP
jgi:hypothetical protein